MKVNTLCYIKIMYIYIILFIISFKTYFNFLYVEVLLHFLECTQKGLQINRYY